MSWYEKAETAKDEWFNRYFCSVNKRWTQEFAEKTYKELCALKSIDPEAVERVIGNTTWTRLECSFCEARVKRAVRMRTDNGVVYLCERCLTAAHRQMFPNGE
jgi:hypothetical protein